MIEKIRYSRLLLVTMVGIFLTTAQGFSASDWAYLKIPCGTRETAMGETGASHSTDGRGMWWNPALVGSGESDAWFEVFKLIAGMRGSSGGAHIPTSWGGAGVFYNNYETSGFEVRDRPGPVQGEFSLHQTVVGAGLAVTLIRQVSIGGTVKLAMEDIYGSRFRTSLVDLGAAWKSDFLAAGLSISNISADKPADDRFPTLLRAGAAKEFTRDSFRALVAAEWTAARNSTPYIHTGVEIDWLGRLYCRTGYMYGHDSRGLSYGLGLKSGKFQADFSLTPFANDLGSTWRFGIRMKI